MALNVIQLAAMPDIEEYATIEEAAADDRVPYTAYWVRRLAQSGKIAARKFGTGARSTWLIHMPSLLDYIDEMRRMGSQKHAQ